MDSSVELLNSPTSSEDYHIDDGRNGVEGCSSQSNGKATEISKKSDKEDRRLCPKKGMNFSSVYLPPVAVPEKIIICFENTPEKGSGYIFEGLKEDMKEPSTYAIRNEIIKLFILNKQALTNNTTKFAVAAVEPENIKWLSTFTSDVSRLLNSLEEDKYTLNQEVDDLNITSVFSNVLSMVDIPQHSNSFIKVIPPDYIIRLIFIYNNSYIIPKVNCEDSSYKVFIKSPYCFLDIFYLHEKQSESNNVESIFKNFGKFVSQTSYLLESSRDVTRVFNTAAKLLAHPCQRVPENMWDF